MLAVVALTLLYLVNLITPEPENISFTRHSFSILVEFNVPRFSPELSCLSLHFVGWGFPLYKQRKWQFCNKETLWI